MDRQMKRQLDTLDQLLKLFSKQKDCIVVINNLGNILYLNANAERMFFATSNHVVGMSINTLILNYNHLENTNRQKHQLYIAIKESKNHFWIDIQTYTFTSGDEQFQVLLINDVHDNKSESELIKQMKIEFLNKMQNLKNGFFSMAKNEEGSIIYTMAIGKLFEEIGVITSTLYRKTPFEVFPRELAFYKQYHYEKAFEGKRTNYEVEFNGRQVYVDITPIVNEGEVSEIVASVNDITELRSTQKELQINQGQFQSLFKFSQDYIIVFNTDSQIIDMNPRTFELFGLSSDDIKNNQIRKQIVESYLGDIGDYFEKAVQGNVQNFEINIVNKNNDKLYFNITLIPIIIDNRIRGIYLIGKDISEQKYIQETNAYLADHDELTNIANRRGIEKKVNRALQNAKNNKMQLAILLIDLDRFKSINDTLGHMIGDQLLKQIAERLLSCLDNEKQYAARMGGDEFMILCQDVASCDEVITIAEKILQSFVSPFFIQDFELLISTSIGISIYPTGGNDLVELMKKADIALYNAKELGRNMYQIYDQSMSKRSYQSFFLERDLRKAIFNNEFIVYLQPRVDALTGKIISAEALIRWEHPEIGLVSPGDFIPLAEETGLIIPIGKWMKRKVCELLVAWRKAGLRLIPISVNISSQRFLQKSFSKDILDLLNEYNLDGEWLEIEITENSIMRNEENVQKTLMELKELGVKIYIDDFGTGYSSFNYLKTFQLDGVKIDRSFIQNISSESENASITTAMIKMAQHLKMEVIAEGVETKGELDYLLEQSCHQIQGFYFGKPCPIKEFERKYLINT
ncbi:EAL domain-containing protein [Lysinibacillus telephonicus]|uniref:EAL domain-containing protein n=1 Tax=Lysinibacillus telephonicus TaxID=1714840 RepID=UPI0031FCCAB4